MQYKAKSTYKKAVVTLLTLGSPAKHQALLDGKAVELTDPPIELRKNLKKYIPKKGK